MTNHKALIFKIKEHISLFWSQGTITNVIVPDGPIHEVLPDFEIIQFAPNSKKEPVIYCTVGASLAEEKQHIKHEFFITAPQLSDVHVATLSMLAYFHADERYRLDIGKVVSIGDPWLPGSSCNYLLISIPYPFGPRLEWLETAYGCVRFLWALPITEGEANFAKVSGVEALEQKFDQGKIDYLDSRRVSVV